MCALSTANTNKMKNWARSKQTTGEPNITNSGATIEAFVAKVYLSHIFRC